MKKIITISIFSLFCAAAVAQHKESDNILDKLVWHDEMLNIMVDTRVDFQTSYSNDAFQDFSFHGQTIKLWVVGEIVPGIRYRIRHRLNKPQTPLREGYSGATDQAWLAFDIGKKKNWTITAGKQSVQFGTFEYDYNPADIYLGTMCFNDLDAYKTGVNVAYRFLGQTINLQVFNSDAPQFADESYSSKALAGSVLWEGNLWDGLIKTRWAYTGFQHTKKNIYNWITAGVQLNVNKFTAEADYYFGDRMMDYRDAVGGDYVVVPASADNRKVRDQSASLNLKYNFGKWRPFIKGIWNDRYDKDSDRDAYDNWGVQAVVEFYPFKGSVLEGLRFHAMYSYNDTSFKGLYNMMPNQDVHSALVGMRWLFKAK